MKYKIGSIVEFENVKNEICVIQITDKHKDISKNQSGFDGVLLNNSSKKALLWGFDNQIKRVLKF